MKISKKTFLKNLPVILILLLAIFLRFFNYYDRIIVSTDQGRDALLALQAIKDHKLPLLGPPSSAWAFNFGPLYYYFIIVFSLIIPGSFGPWIGFTLLSVLSVWLLSRIDKIGIYLALVAAISFGEINNSLNLLNTALVSFAVVLSFYSAYKVLATKSKIFAIILGFSVALTINCHLQALSLLSLIPLTLIFVDTNLKERLILLISQIIGFVTAFIPLLYFESMHYFAWTKSILDYAINGQNKFYTPVRWLTEITQFWPHIFGNTVFANPEYGYGLIALIAFAILISLIKKIKPTRLTLVIGLVFLVEVLSVRYYKGPRSSEYFVVTIPFVIYFVGWSLGVLHQVSKKMAIVAMSAVLLLNLININTLLKTASKAPEVISLYEQITQRYPKVDLFAFSWSDEAARTLYYLLMKNDKLTSDRSNLLAICYLRDSEGKAVEFCPKDNREIRVGKFIIYQYKNLLPSDIAQYEVASISSEILYKRNYNNYELIKY